MNARVACLFVLGLALSACGTTPARPRPIAPVHQVVVPNGEYLVEFHSQWTGPVHARMTFEALPDGFKANTRPGVAWDMVGGIEALLGPVLMPFLFPRGMILVWSSGLPTRADDGRTVPGEGTIGVGDFERLRVRTQFASADSPIVVRLRDGRAVGVLTLRKVEEVRDRRPTDYVELAQRAGELIREHWFDRAALESAPFRSAWKGFVRNAESARDDAEFLFGAVVAFRSNLRTSMPLLFPDPTPQISGPLVDGVEDLVRPYRIERDEKTGLTTLRVYAFLDAASVDEAMREATSGGTRGLIVDLRRCPGITLASLRLASLLLPERAEAGTVFTPDARDAATAETAAQPPAAVGGAWSDEEIARVDRVLADQGLAALSVEPDRSGAARFDGPVAVLTSRRTSASAELLVHVLTASGRAVVVGERTAGRPMLGRPFNAGQGWTLIVPSLDHRPASGPPLGGRGMEPDRRVSRDAPALAARLLLEQLEPARN